MASPIANARHWYLRANQFFSHTIWDTRLDELPRKTAALYRAARIAQRTISPLVLGQTLYVRAAALTFFTVLSVVPFLAFAFALLKGLGAYDVLVQQKLEPYALELLAANPSLRSALEQILSFVENTGVASLGFLGLLTVLYAATRLLYNIEAAFNELWGVAQGRTLMQQFQDYLLIMIVTPLSLLAGAALTTVGQALSIFQSASASLGLSTLIDQIVSVAGPLCVLFIGLAFLYKVLPFTHVRISSAAVGAAVSALLWYVVLIVHVRFQVGVARYNALYSSFAAVPVFLAWLQVSWLVVLVGAQVAAEHQNGGLLAQRMRLLHVDRALRESIGLTAMLRITAAFEQPRGALSLEELANRLDVHEVLLAELLEKLRAAELVVRAVPESQPRYVLARPPDQVRAKQVLDALRAQDSGREETTLSAQVPRTVSDLWCALDRAAAESPDNRTLRELLTQALAEEPDSSSEKEPSADADDSDSDPRALH